MNIQKSMAFGQSTSSLRKFINANPGTKITVAKEGDSFSATLLKSTQGPYAMVTTDIFPTTTKFGALKKLSKIFKQTIGKAN